MASAEIGLLSTAIMKSLVLVTCCGGVLWNKAKTVRLIGLMVKENE